MELPTTLASVESLILSDCLILTLAQCFIFAIITKFQPAYLFPEIRQHENVCVNQCAKWTPRVKTILVSFYSKGFFNSHSNDYLSKSKILNLTQFYLNIPVLDFFSPAF